MSLLLERLDALEYLEGVVLGAPVEQLSPERAGQLSAAVMSTLRPSFASPVPAERAASLFVALLSHGDLPGFVLSRVAADGLVGHPDVFAALVAHPGCTDEVLLEAALSAWEQAGPTGFSSGPFADLSRYASRDRLRPRLFDALPAAGLTGRLAAYLLQAFPRDNQPYFSTAFSFLDEPVPVREVALAFLEDARLSGFSRGPALTPELALERARLVLSA